MTKYNPKLQVVNNRLKRGEGWIGYRYVTRDGHRIPSSTLYFAFYQNGKQKFVKTETNDPEQAYRELLAARNIIKSGQQNLPQEVSKIRYEHIRDSYRRDHTGTIQGLKNFDKFFRNARVTEITSETLKDYIDARREEVEDPTIRRELVNLRAMFNQAKREGILGSADVPYFPMPEDSDEAGVYIEPHDFDRILSALDPKNMTHHRRKGKDSDLRPLFTFLYNTGCRLGAARNITWDMVSGRCDVINIPARLMKARQPLMLVLDGPMLSPIAGMLRKMFRTDGPVFNSTNYRTEWSRAIAKAGLGTFNPITTERTGPRIHDCRCSAAINMDEAGISRDRIMKIGGWKTEKMFSRYNRMDETRTRKAMIKAGQYVADRMSGTES